MILMVLVLLGLIKDAVYLFGLLDRFAHLLVDELVEKDCNEPAYDWAGHVNVSHAPSVSTACVHLLEGRAQRDRWIQAGKVVFCTRDHHKGRDVGCCDDQGGDCRVLGELGRCFGLSQIKERKEEGAYDLSCDSVTNVLGGDAKENWVVVIEEEAKQTSEESTNELEQNV